MTAEQIAEEWAERITQRMRELNIPESEVAENAKIIRAFCKTGVELLKNEPFLKPPKKDKPIPLSDEKAHLIIDLFLRGVNQATRQLRGAYPDWEVRKGKIEDVSWKIFNLAKLLVALQLDPMPTFRSLLHKDQDLKMMMKHSTNELLRHV